MAFKYLNDATIGAGAIASNVLPPAANVAEGTFAYDSVAGPVYQKGGSWLALASNVFSPSGLVTSNTGNAAATGNFNAITAVIVAAALAGGGFVQLPAVPANQSIPISAPLAMLSGVHLLGVAPQLVYNTIPDSGLTTLVGSAGGTILQPMGAFAGISWNTTALAAPASQTAFSQTGLTNISIENIGFSGAGGGTWAILAGATNNASAWYSKFINLYATGFTAAAGGGFSITNYQHCDFAGNYTFGCQWGQLHQIDVASASLAPGNSTYKDLYNVNTPGAAGLLQRNVSFLTTATTGGAANNNEFKFDRMQSNRFGGASISQAATMVNTQANITITDGTKFAVGLPVSVDATQNGFTLKKVYFVISVAANVIQLSNTYGGAAVTATAANAVNIVHTGFPCFEMIAAAGSTNTNVIMDNVDCEGLSTAAMVFQNVNGGTINVSQVPSVVQATQSIVCRGCANMTFNCPQSVSTDWDNNAVGQVMGFFGSRFGTCVGYVGYGLWYDTVSAKFVFSLGYQNDTQSSGFITWDSATAGGLALPKNAGLGQLPKNVNSVSFTVTNLNCVYSNGTAAAVYTLPTVSAANAGAWVEIMNYTAGTQTINTDGVQLFNNIAARTAITLNAGASVRLNAAQTTTGPAYTWSISGGTSAMAAGVISAPT